MNKGSENSLINSSDKNEDLYLNACISVFSFLSSMFLYSPEISFLEMIKDKNIFSNWPVNRETLNEVLESIKMDLKKIDVSYMTDIENDYFELFVGTRKMFAPPYESVYLGREGILFDNETLKIRQLYLKYGFAVNEKNKIPDDHIGYELNFISELLGLASDYYKKGEIENSYAIRDALYDFIKDHIIRWIDLFCSRVEKNSSTIYYKDLSRLTKISLLHLFEYLEEKKKDQSNIN